MLPFPHPAYVPLPNATACLGALPLSPFPTEKNVQKWHWISERQISRK